jgi:hypothetical protein
LGSVRRADLSENFPTAAELVVHDILDVVEVHFPASALPRAGKTHEVILVVKGEESESRSVTY